MEPNYRKPYINEFVILCKQEKYEEAQAVLDKLKSHHENAPKTINNQNVLLAREMNEKNCE